MLDNFAVFITTHGRANKVATYDTLRKHGYTGKIYLICDDEDKTLDEYQRKYGDEVIVFDKEAAAQYVDAGDNSPSRKAVVYARNECYRIARELELQYILQVDDDYKDFNYTFDSKFKYLNRPIRNLDRVFSATLKYFASIPAYCVTFAQGGDFFGGEDADYAKTVMTRRKIMNTFFLDVDRQFSFFGRMNDDVNAYVTNGYQGKLMLSLMQLRIEQLPTQSASGGMTEVYQDLGTYQKSFYSVMYAPAFVKIVMMGTKHRRLHHMVVWENAAPRILDERWRKAR